MKPKTTHNGHALCTPALAAACLALLTLGPTTQGATTMVAITGDDAPDPELGIDGVFNDLDFPVLNNTGQVAFQAGLSNTFLGEDDDEGIFRYDGPGSITPMIREFQEAPGIGAEFDGFSSPTLNDLGQVAYTATTDSQTNPQGIFRSDNTTTTAAIHYAGQHPPGTPGGAEFQTFFSPVLLNNAGQVAFQAGLRNGSGGVDVTNNSGIWQDNTLVARTGSQAPDVPVGALFNTLDYFGPPTSPALNNAGQFLYWGELRTGSGGVDFTNSEGTWLNNTLLQRAGSQAPGTPQGTLFGIPFGYAINDAGQVAIGAFLQQGAGGVDETNDTGLWLDNTLVARAGSSAPDTPTGTVFNFVGFPSFNNAGQIAYWATLQTESGGVDDTNNSGIWLDSTLLVRKGSHAPGTPEGTAIEFFGNQMLNEGGQIAFRAALRSGLGGVDDTNEEGIWVYGPNGNAMLVVREAGELAGRTIDELGIFANPRGSDGQGRSFNNFSQVTYHATFTNGDQGVFLFTPDLRWISPDSGHWDDAGADSNWTLGQAPGQVHDVSVDTDTDLTVTGPGSDITVNSLQIGGGNGIATLSLANGTIESLNGVQITTTGILTGDGVIDADLHVAGQLNPGNSTGQIRVTGGATFEPTSAIIIELAGDDFTQHNQVNITGDVSFDGLLNLVLLNDFIPAYGDTFDILTYGTRDGVFSQVTGHFLSPVLALGQFYDDAIDTLTLLATAPGDANGDLVVNIADFGLLAGNFNQPGTWETGDFNGDGITNINDFGLLAANFNGDFNAFTSAAESFGITIPEPGTVMLIICGLMGIGGSQRRNVVVSARQTRAHWLSGRNRCLNAG